MKVLDQPESSKIKVLGVNIEKGYNFRSHTIQTVVSLKIKVEKMFVHAEDVGHEENTWQYGESGRRLGEDVRRG